MQQQTGTSAGVTDAADDVADRLAALLLDRFGTVDRPVVVAVGGPGGTGKTTLALRLRERLPDAAVLRLDDYKTARALRKEQGIYGAHPSANRMALVAEHLGLLRAGVAFEKPVYVAADGEATCTERYLPRRFNLVDGEVATYHVFRGLVDFSIFVDAHWRTQLETRLTRDIDERGYTPEKAIATFLHSNLREYAEHGAESRTWADVGLHRHPGGAMEILWVRGEAPPPGLGSTSHAGSKA